MSGRFYRTLCLLGVFMVLSLKPVSGQSKKYYWQQQISYKMDVKVDTEKNQFTGKQTIRYRNNSPDALNKVFFHLYLNAFQPGSEMDVRSRTLPDPDPRVADRIFHLKPDEIGYQKIRQLKQNGVPLRFETVGTILEVDLDKPILPRPVNCVCHGV